LGTLIPLISARFKPNCLCLYDSGITRFNLILILSHAGDIFQGERFQAAIPWIPAIG